jgi:hypothetical protein
MNYRVPVAAGLVGDCALVPIGEQLFRGSAATASGLAVQVRSWRW